MKTIIAIILTTLTLKAFGQHCDNVQVAIESSPNIDFSFESFGKYLAGITQNGSTKVKVTVSNSIGHDPDCRWNLVIYVENVTSSAANTEWEEVFSNSTSGSTPKIDLLQLRIRNNCNTPLTGNQFFNVPAITGTPIMVISNTGITIPAGSCTTNVNGPGNATANYNEFVFNIDYRLVPALGLKSGVYQLKVKYLLTEAI